ncbi:hypothetical protein [Streptacidiphilus cavernicola]|uniref:Uncharacterized protein n=1 Tax=Streptacidiphilus cavernicola TaxID=3342716 RepID=A0ABV6VYF9_9ACTN
MTTTSTQSTRTERYMDIAGFGVAAELEGEGEDLRIVAGTVHGRYGLPMGRFQLASVDGTRWMVSDAGTGWIEEEPSSIQAAVERIVELAKKHGAWTCRDWNALEKVQRKMMKRRHELPEIIAAARAEAEANSWYLQ